MGRREDLVDLILRAGQLEKFVEWLRSRGVDTSMPMKLEEVDPALIEEYVREKRLVEEGGQKFFDEEDRLEEQYEPLEVRPSTPPKRR